MQIYYSNKFAKEYKKLPSKTKLQAEKKEKIFREEPHHPSLKTHRLSGRLKDFWAFSVDYHYRIVFEFRENDVIWFHSIGTHEIYS